MERYIHLKQQLVCFIEKGDKSQEEITKQIKDRSVKLKKGGVVIKQKSIMLKGRGGSFKGTY
jgi:hypothetical protein